MRYITSRAFELPQDPNELRESYYFNMWQKQNWPYRDLSEGDTLYWYESPSQQIVWKSRVVNVSRFEYGSKREASARLVRDFGDFLDEQQPYFRDAPSHGYCLGYRVEPLAHLQMPKPSHLRFPMLGWFRDQRAIEEWLKA